jgi:hypothetical protein
LNFQIITESPSWFIVFCLLAGFIYSLVLYRNDHSFDGATVWVKRMMALFRFTCVSILCFLLLTPLIRTIFREIEKPIIVILQDESESVRAISDSVSFLGEYPQAIKNIQKDLAGDFDVRLFRLGDHVSEGIDFIFNQKETDLAAPVEEIKSRFAGRNLGAVLLASDGIYNKGNNPLYAFPQLKVPVYTIGLGDTTVRKDILISRVNHNQTAFFGNTFPVEVTVDARQCSGNNVTLTISKNKKELFSKQISLSSDRVNMVIPIFLEANEKGINHYKAEISRLENEINVVNNSRDFYVEVTDTRQQILLVANAPHPDIRVIKNVIESNPNYQLVNTTIEDFDGNLSGINLAILHMVPSVNAAATALTDNLQKQNIPVFYITGSQSAIPLFNKLNTGVTVNDNRGNTNEIMAEPNRDFSLYTMEEEHLRLISSFPPLLSPFGNYIMQGNVYTLLTQRVGNVKTGMPLLYFSSEGDRKSAVLAGEGIWKWSLREYAENNNADAVNALILKTVQYLSSRERKTPFRLFYKNSYAENEQLLIDAEFYNQSGELVNLSDAKISIVNEAKQVFPFTFSKTEKAYSLNAGYIPVGNYQFTARLVSGNKTYTETGSFTIQALQAELTETIANHNLLRSISDRTGGKYYERAGAGSIAEELKKRNDIKPVSYTQKRLDDVINLKWIFALIIFLISAEWFLRKRSGSY